MKFFESRVTWSKSTVPLTQKYLYFVIVHIPNMGPGAFGEIEPNRMKMKWGSKTIKISNLKAKMEEKKLDLLKYFEI